MVKFRSIWLFTLLSVGASNLGGCKRILFTTASGQSVQKENLPTRLQAVLSLGPLERTEWSYQMETSKRDNTWSALIFGTTTEAAFYQFAKNIQLEVRPENGSSDWVGQYRRAFPNVVAPQVPDVTVDSLSGNGSIRRNSVEVWCVFKFERSSGSLLIALEGYR